MSEYGRRVTLFSGLEARPPRAFCTNLPALDAFPAAVWARITARRSRHSPASLLMGCEPIGYAPLRAVVAHYVGMSRGVRCLPDQVVIVSRVQEALEATSYPPPAASV